MSTKRLNKCGSCGAEMTGRSDKKYCSTACRNDANNTRYKPYLTHYVKTEKMLRTNFLILHNILGDINELEMSDKELLKRGLKPNYVTYVGKGNVRLIYNIQLKKLLDGKHRITRVL